MSHRPLLCSILLLAGCALPKDEDTADTGDTAESDTTDPDTADTDTDTPDTDTGTDTGDTGDDGRDARIMGMNGTCGGRTCTWEVNTTGRTGRVELTLIETGDPAYSCILECDVWAEEHDAFVTTDTDAEGETKALALALTELWESQSSNSTTLFDVNEASTAAQLTVLFMVYDPDGNYADCATFGHMPEHFRDVCTNNANEW